MIFISLIVVRVLESSRYTPDLQSGLASDKAEDVADSGQVPLHFQFARFVANLGGNALHMPGRVSGSAVEVASNGCV